MHVAKPVSQMNWSPQLPNSPDALQQTSKFPLIELRGEFQQ